jgi:CRP/FNR family cyclic AMP-dependent transcriptional regulator
MDSDLFGKMPLFKELNPEERQALASHFVLRRHPKNTVVIHEGDDTDSLYVILEGRVKVYLDDEAGKEVVLNIEGPGEYFGEVALFDEGPRSASVMTLEDCHFAVLMRQEFISCLTEHPRLAFSIIQGLTRRLRALSENVRSLALMDVYGRVARLLMELASEQNNGRWVIRERLTHHDLANRIGASSKMVSRIMQDLIKGGYIRKEAQQIIIEHHLPPAW